MQIFFFVFGIGLILGGIYLNLPKFGKQPTGKRLERIKKSPNYKDGSFQNIEPTPQFSSDRSRVAIIYDFLFRKAPDLYPSESIPSVKTDLKALAEDQNILVWLGHSAYYIQIAGKKFLIDPTLLTASPIAGTNPPFEGADIYKPSDMPEVDYLIITHDHWDHLDYESVLALKDKIGQVVLPLGNGEHFEHWGFATEKLIELDWHESVSLAEGLKITALPARHYSGRGIIRSKWLWASYMIETSLKTIYMGGDSGYGAHYKNIGESYKKIDWAIMENGQYGKDWKNIHIHPEELPQAIEELNPQQVLTFHNSKYALANHRWSEPMEKMEIYVQRKGLKWATPKIGEIVYLDKEDQTFSKWWRK